MHVYIPEYQVQNINVYQIKDELSKSKKPLHGTKNFLVGILLIPLKEKATVYAWGEVIK